MDRQRSEQNHGFIQSVRRLWEQSFSMNYFVHHWVSQNTNSSSNIYSDTWYLYPLVPAWSADLNIPRERETIWPRLHILYSHFLQARQSRVLWIRIHFIRIQSEVWSDRDLTMSVNRDQIYIKDYVSDKKLTKHLIYRLLHLFYVTVLGIWPIFDIMGLSIL